MSHSRQVSIKNKNNFYREYYHNFIIMLLIAIASMVLLMLILFYQLSHRHYPDFFAITEDGQQQRELLAYNEPILLSDAILRWAGKAAVAAYTFDFVNYTKQLEFAHYFFTPTGWDAYQGSVAALINQIKQKQLFVNGVVSGTPVIVFQGYENGQYVWHIQLPFLVSYQSAESVDKANFIVNITLVRVPAGINPDGIGIDRFIMTGG